MQIFYIVFQLAYSIYSNIWHDSACVNGVKQTDIWFQPYSLGGLLWFSYLIAKATGYFPSQSMCSTVQLSTWSRTDIFPVLSGLLTWSAS